MSTTPKNTTPTKRAKTVRTPTNTTSTAKPSVLDVADILLTHYGYRDLSKLRTVSKYTSALHKDAASRLKQASQLMDTMAKYGLPMELAQRLMAFPGVYHTLRSNRYPFTEHDPTGWRKYPNKCILWKAWGRKNNFKFAISIKGYVDVVVGGQVVQRTNALIILNHYQYGSKQKPTMYGQIFLQKRPPRPELSIMNDRNGAYSLFGSKPNWDMDLVADLIVNACRKPAEREPVAIRTSQLREAREREGFHLPRHSILNFTADAKAPW